MKKTILTLMVMVGMLAVAGQAFAMTATLTADNHYGLYFGSSNGSTLTFVGRNETGAAGSPGSFNWSLPETWTFNVASGDHLYVVAWDDTGIQSLLGEFALANSTTLYTNTVDWEFYVSANPNPGLEGPVPSLPTLQGEIAGASWGTPLGAGNLNDGTVFGWGHIPGISSDASFVWHDTFSDSSSSDNNYVIYRTINEVPTIPEPASMMLFGMGSGVMGFLARRKNKK